VRAGVCQIALVGTPLCQLPTVAKHAVALAEFQVRVDLPPLLMVVGAALSVTVGAGAPCAAGAVGVAGEAGAVGEAGAAGVATDTATDCVVVPPEPLQVNV
jgi:hypothetical protein